MEGGDVATNNMRRRRRRQLNGEQLHRNAKPPRAIGRRLATIWNRQAGGARGHQLMHSATGSRLVRPSAGVGVAYLSFAAWGSFPASRAMQLKARRALSGDATARLIAHADGKNSGIGPKGYYGWRANPAVADLT